MVCFQPSAYGGIEMDYGSILLDLCHMIVVILCRLLGLGVT
jgi:hypothetical protein